jgi:hypothetical protein
MPRSSRETASRAIRSRDAGLRKVSVVTRVLVAGSVVSAALFSALAAWAQPGRSKTLRTSAAQSQVLPGRVSRVGATVTTPALSDPASPSTTVSDQQTAASQGAAGAQQLSPPTTAPDTVPAPVYQTTTPPPVVVSGAS